MAATGVASRRAQQRATHASKGDRQERALIDAAARLIETGEATTASVADIADAAGISRAAFYFYFASKQALLAAVVDETVAKFNASIVAVAEVEYAQPADAVRSTLNSAARLWWEHAAVMTASVGLGTTMPDVYSRTMENISIVRAPTVALLRRYGRVPEAGDDAAAAELVTSLILMCERNFYDLMRGDPSEADRDRLTERLTAIWLRSFGIEDGS